MGNDFSSKISTQTPKLLHDPSQAPYATFIIKLFLREFYSYYEDKSKNYSNVNKLYKHKRAVIAKIFDGVQVLEDGPYDSYKGREWISWGLDIEIPLSRENFSLFYNNPIELKLAYYNYFGIYEAEFVIKDWKELCLSILTQRETVEFKKTAGSGESIYSEINLSLVGPYLEEMISLELPVLEIKQQKELLNFVGKYSHSVFLNERHSKWLDNYYEGEKIAGIIISTLEKIIQTKEDDEEFLKWASSHYNTCRFRSKNGDIYPVSSEKMESLVALFEKQENPSEILRETLDNLDCLVDKDCKYRNRIRGHKKSDSDSDS